MFKFKTLKNNGAIARILFWLVLFLPTILALWRSHGNGRTWQTLLWAAAACLFPAILPPVLFIAVQWLCLLLLPVLLWWIAYAALNGIGPGWEAAVAAISTSPQEASGAALLAINTPNFLLFAVACSLLLIASIVLMFRARKSHVLNDASQECRKVLFVLALAPFFISFMTNATGVHLPVLFIASDPSFSTLGTTTRLLWEGVDQIMYGDIMTVAPERRKAVAPRMAKDVRLAIFVIGESMRAGGIGPAQKQRGPWTKALNERVENHLGVWLPTTCAGANGTAGSVPMLLTGLAPRQYAESGTAPSVLAVLKAAGYKTAWISNQDKSVFTEHGHDYYWTITHSASVSDSYDEQLVPIAKTFAAPILNHGTQSRIPYAMALHMHGSHFDYQDRYPVSQFAAEPTGLSYEDLVDLRYERTEEYTAKVINDLAALLDASEAPSFLIYSSDHGENLPSDHNGVTTHLGPRATLRDGTTTSFVLWNSAMQKTGKPTEILSQLMKEPMIAHADVAKIFLALAGVGDEAIVTNLPPEILAPVELGGSYNKPNACSLLKP
ncbi:sulfatase-like hydrolase/transferase [Solimicrobium silvestre]|uniref:Sulfatase n=1 Tax=Solimicrobium silvestre TaxID=2099400 RepID=A0A2S9GZ91_9BURK|nr:sulfatase-like hydrolase/transferase [Solimicrobium silvestre]PRC93052.1 Sulfatase [Solimicrobium silvestre]